MQLAESSIIFTYPACAQLLLLLLTNAHDATRRCALQGAQVATHHHVQVQPAALLNFNIGARARFARCSAGTAVRHAVSAQLLLPAPPPPPSPRAHATDGRAVVR